MSTALQFIFYAVAFLLFLLSAANVPAPRVTLVAAGLAVWVAVPMIVTARAL